MHHQLDALVVSERMEHVKSLVRILDGLTINVYVACSVKQALEVLCRQSLALVFCDERIPGGSYRELLQSGTDTFQSLSKVFSTMSRNED